MARLLLVSFLLESCYHTNNPLYPTKEKNREAPPSHIMPQGTDASTLKEEEKEVAFINKNLSNQIHPADSPAFIELPSGSKMIVQGVTAVIKKDDGTKANQLSKHRSRSCKRLPIANRVLIKERLSTRPGKASQSIRNQHHLEAGQKTSVEKREISQQKEANQSVTRLLINQVCTAKTGHQVRFEKKAAGGLQALVTENFPTGFSKIHYLPVVILPSLSCSERSVSNTAWQKQFIHVTKDCVYIGQMGLLGGGEDEKSTTTVLPGEEEEEVISPINGEQQKDKDVEKVSKDVITSKEISFPKQAIKSLCQLGSEVGEEHYRDKVLEILAIEALNKDSNSTFRYLKKT
jgi:hypothetical protein